MKQDTRQQHGLTTRLAAAPVRCFSVGNAGPAADEGRDKKVGRTPGDECAANLLRLRGERWASLRSTQPTALNPTYVLHVLGFDSPRNRLQLQLVMYAIDVLERTDFSFYGSEIYVCFDFKHASNGSHASSN